MKRYFTSSSPHWEPRPIAGWPDGLILFDGVCILCTSWVHAIIKRDTARRFRFLRIQSCQGKILAEQLGIDPEQPETNAVILDGMAYFKSDAALVVMRNLPGTGWIRALNPIPVGLRNWLYDRIARNRYALFGRHEACVLPTPELAGRFLDDFDKAGSA